MAQTIKIKRSTSSSAPSLLFGELAVTDVSGVTRYWVGDQNNVAVEIAGDNFALLASPTFTGVPAAPTASLGVSTTQIATTAFVANAVAAAATSVDYKDGVRLASAAGIANLSLITVANFDGQAQGVTLVAGDRVLVWQASSADGIEAVSAKREGIYVVGTVTAGTAALTRSSDADVSSEVTNGMTITNVSLGTYAQYRFTLTTADPIVLDTTLLNFVGIPNAGYSAGDGISLTSNAIAVVASQLVGNGIDASSNNFIVKADVTTGATVAPLSVVANGAGVSLDNASIVHASGVLSVALVDGGTF